MSVVRPLCLALFLLFVATGRAEAFELGFQDDPLVVRDPVAYRGNTGGLLAREAAFAAAGRLGMRAVRINVFWDRVERRDGSFDFSRYDAAIDASLAAGLRPQLTLTGPAPGGKAPEPAPFAAFARAAATRYAGRVRTYSIWNEPNWRGYLPRGAPERRYRRLFRAGALAIRRAAPGARVLIGELAPMGRLEAAVPPLRFLRGVLRGRAPLVADGLALHPYTLRWGPRYPGPTADDVTTGSLARATRFVRRAARSGALHTPAGGPLPLYLTEYGWHADSRRIPERQRARYLRTGLALARASGARQLIWYQMAGPPRLADGHRIWDTGLLNFDGTPRPAFHALARHLGRG